jgi:hypothetical protein
MTFGTRNPIFLDSKEQLMLLTDVFPIYQTLDYFKSLLTSCLDKNFCNFRLINKQSKHCDFKVHSYSESIDRDTFVLELVEKDSLKFCMTAFGADIKQGDFIVINNQISSTTYKVESIDYYLDPEDMWMALLIKCSH